MSKRETITVRRESGETEQVDAHVAGPWAIHEAIERPAKWALTHLPSGSRFPLMESAEEAVAVHRAVKHLDWDFDRKEDFSRETALEATRLYREITGREPRDRPTITIREEA